MGLSTLSKTSADKKAAPEAEPIAADTGGGLIIPTTAASSMLAVIAQADQGGGPVFPTLTVTGGAQGGTFTPMKGMDQAISDQLPQGLKPVECVFIAYRTELAAWPCGYDDRSEDDKHPSWSVAVSAGDVNGSKLIEAACNAYQFTPKAEKSKFDYEANKIGHIRPSLQLLVWEKNTKDLLIVQATAGYESWTESLKNLAKLADPQTGEIKQVPLSIRVRTEDRKNKSFQWKVHMLAPEVNVAGGASLLKAYAEWRQTVPPEKAGQVIDWMNAADRQMTDDIKRALELAGSWKKR